MSIWQQKKAKANTELKIEWIWVKSHHSLKFEFQSKVVPLKYPLIDAAFMSSQPFYINQTATIFMFRSTCLTLTRKKSISFVLLTVSWKFAFFIINWSILSSVIYLPFKLVQHQSSAIRMQCCRKFRVARK